ncbi:thiol reductant ABC exporter subunit CydC [Lactobacillus sp. LC28-10]|uniref:Thiol reductant ABC exporter subunit CydC n=1 Tax=Secundilactobacillus angelensis TaxID=2722706 RepID=A0ABX1KWJ6_9LACO|nr:thiol reductant ABC exporter subunit CydC [Secundilactobacillus angelensis]MCH5462523.1 thiol reductant ABC exporter subunit CydC [Secundilactobacillus angelensis]NLR18286.1 thiol reductant ABC exporter subunit CydC [Secundilactobacillus angelensis]
MHSIKETFAHDTWVMPYLRKYKWLLTLVLFLGMMTFLSAAALMFNSGYLISEAARRPDSIIYIYVPVVLARGFGIARPVFRYSERLTSHNWVLRIVSDFRKKLYQAVEVKASAIKQTHQTGDILSILAEDIDHIENLYLRTVFPIVIGWLLYLLIIIGVGVFSWPVALLMALLLGMIVMVMPMLSVAVNGAREFKQKQIQSNSYTNLTDEVLGLTDWVVSGRYDDFMTLQTKPIKSIAALRKKDHFFQWWRGFGIQIFFLLAVVTLLIWSGVTFTATKGMANWIAAFALTLFPIVEPFLEVSQGASEWPIYRQSIDRVNQLSNDQPKETAQSALTAPVSEINVDHVTFSYPGDDKVILKDLSLNIKRGEKIALLGPSGTGKSTLLKLLLGDQTPTVGSVTINGTPVSELQKQRAQIFGVLDQQPYLFDTSVMNNIRLGNLDATDDQVKAAVEAVELKPLIESLPDGYDTEVQESGTRFSGGERQRLSLARILLQDAPVIVLDEPTVSLDPITERQLLDTVFKVLHDKTIIWVTHHLAGIDHVDQVRFLEDGVFDMQGTPQALYRDEPRFRKLYALDAGENN